MNSVDGQQAGGNRAAARRSKAQPWPILRLGFRLFFWLAGVWAVAAMAIWIAIMSGTELFGGMELPLAAPGPLWHGHEFIFGYAFAVVAGFLFTAIPNWTGRLPVSGAPLALLAGLWLLARLTMMLGGAVDPVISAVGALAFPVVFTLLVAREILASGKIKNLPVLVALSCLVLADVVFQLGTIFDLAYHDIALRLAIAILALLIALIGGRVTPSFTRNWLAKRKATKMPAPMDIWDHIAMAVTAVALICWVVWPQAVGSAMALFAGAFALALRLSRWRGLHCWREPLLLVLHLGYAWLPVGLALLGWSIVSTELAMADAQHALTTGAVGTMTLAMMTRASLGHSDRPLTADGVTVAIFALITIAGMGRLWAGFAFDGYMTLISLSAAAWIGAFALFLVSYSPILFGHRKTTER